MPAGLDHIVHAVRNLDAGADFYRRMGFTVGARNTHSQAWGTQNHIVQLPGTFIELLAVNDTNGIAPHTPHFFSFGAFNRDFLVRGEGLSMLALEGRGGADADAFRAAGIGDFDLYDFEREAKRPDGTAVKVAFTLAFARDEKTPEAGFFTCQQRYPENFWNEAFQIHGNTARGVAGVVIVANDPAAHRDFLCAFSGSAWEPRDDGFAFITPRGEIGVTTPAGYFRQFGIAPPDVAEGARLAAMRFTVADLAAVRITLEAGRIPGKTAGGLIVVGPQTAMGAALAFETMAGPAG